MAAICERITQGMFVEDAAKAEGITGTTLRTWTNENPDLLAMYARAREASADALAEEALKIAHGIDGLGVMATELADEYAGSLENDNDRHEYLARFETVRAQRDRLRVDTLKWTAAKRRPKVYGDKVDVTSDGEPLAAPQIITIAGRSITF